jgi:hypothetical protein
MFEVLISIFILCRHVDKNAILGIIFGVIGTIVTSYGSIAKLDLAWIEIASIIIILVANFLTLLLRFIPAQNAKIWNHW